MKASLIDLKSKQNKFELESEFSRQAYLKVALMNSTETMENLLRTQRDRVVSDYVKNVEASSSILGEMKGLSEFFRSMVDDESFTYEIDASQLGTRGFPSKEVANFDLDFGVAYKESRILLAEIRGEDMKGSISVPVIQGDGTIAGMERIMAMKIKWMRCSIESRSMLGRVQDCAVKVGVSDEGPGFSTAINSCDFDSLSAKPNDQVMKLIESLNKESAYGNQAQAITFTPYSDKFRRSAAFTGYCETDVDHSWD
jgi:hypothetical protein